MPTKRCCCQPSTSCLIGTDTFNRPNENPVSGNWNELGGDWEVLDNELNSITPGVLLTTLRQPAPTIPGRQYSITMSVEIVSIASGIWEIICGYTSPGVYDSIRLTDDGTGNIYPEFLQNGVSIMDKTTHPQMGPFQLADGKLEINICYAEFEWSVGASNTQTVWTACNQGGLAALPTAPNGMVGFYRGRFDNWEYYIHYDSNPACFWCTCACRITSSDMSCLPETLTLTLKPLTTHSWSGMSPGSCNPPSDLTMTLHQENPDATGAAPVFGLPYRNAKKFIWYSELLVGDYPGLAVDVPTKQWFMLICDSDDFTLVEREYPTDYAVSDTSNINAWESPDGIWNNGKVWDKAASTCVPLSLVFRNLVFTRSFEGPSGCYVYGGRYDAYVMI